MLSESSRDPDTFQFFQKFLLTCQKPISIIISRQVWIFKIQDLQFFCFHTPKFLFLPHTGRYMFFWWYCSLTTIQFQSGLPLLPKRGWALLLAAPAGRALGLHCLSRPLSPAGHALLLHLTLVLSQFSSIFYTPETQRWLKRGPCFLTAHNQKPKCDWIL